MKKLIVVLLVFLLLSLTACGFNRNSNGPPNTQTQINGNANPNAVPNTGNKKVDIENDVGIPDKNENNDHLFVK
jgi:outer membrane lipopolysaccharide assembly protein LptE/RlpB